MDDIGRAMYRMKKSHVVVRSRPASAVGVGSCTLDPDGLTLEYSRMEEFPNSTRASRDWWWIEVDRLLGRGAAGFASKALSAVVDVSSLAGKIGM
jgi:hypothetical protein